MKILEFVNYLNRNFDGNEKVVDGVSSNDESGEVEEISIIDLFEYARQEYEENN
jgi:hypothetical protein